MSVPIPILPFSSISSATVPPFLNLMWFASDVCVEPNKLILPPTSVSLPPAMKIPPVVSDLWIAPRDALLRIISWSSLISSASVPFV